jgi:hypothetical protein
MFVWVAAYWVPLVALFFTKTRRADLLVIGFLILQYLAAGSGLFPNSNWGNSIGL